MATKKTAARLAAASRRAARAAVKAIEQVRRFEDGVLKAGESFVRNEITYVVDKAGRAVRQPNKDRPVTREDCLFLLKNVRAVTDDEVLEAVGPNVHKWFLDSGMLVRDTKARSLLWITKKAQAYYGLPLPMIGGVACAFQ